MDTTPVPMMLFFNLLLNKRGYGRQKKKNKKLFWVAQKSKLLFWVAQKSNFAQKSAQKSKFPFLSSQKSAF